jgi:6-phosphogluconolactonase
MPDTRPGKILIFKDPLALAENGAKRFVKLARSSIADRKRFSVCLSGGRTPRAMYQLLTEPRFRNRVDWNHVHVFWGDERFVAPDDPRNSFHMARETLLDHVPIPAENIYPITTACVTPEQAAQRYAETLTAFSEGATPRFDLIFLGLGADGHTASLFAGQAEKVSAVDNLVAVVRDSPKPPPIRLTLTYKVINNSANIVFLVTGGDKAAAVGAVLGEKTDEPGTPARLISPREGNLLWLLDVSAAAELKRP